MWPGKQAIEGVDQVVGHRSLQGPGCGGGDERAGSEAGQDRGQDAPPGVAAWMIGFASAN
jgi:hypothetical protein